MTAVRFMKGNSWIRIIAVLTVSVGFTIFLFAHSQETVINSREAVTEDDAINKAIRGLWSARDLDRASAKDQILQLGRKSIPALIKLLEDVANNPGPRFASGREEEGRHVWERVQSANFDKLDIHELDALREVEITWRLYRDALEPLGQLRAEAAVPLVVRLMSTDGPVLSKKNSEMQALVEIGSAAVPKLLEIIETSDEILASDDYWLGADHEYAQGPRKFRFVPHFIKSRAAMVLGRIGDSSVLPALESALKRASDRDLIESLQEAIRHLSTAHKSSGSKRR